MVNDHNIRVGCAASDYTVYHESEYKLCTLLTCNYATSNKNGAPVYDANCTKAAVKCLSDSKSKIIGLCPVDEKYIINTCPSNEDL